MVLTSLVVGTAAMAASAARGRATPAAAPTDAGRAGAAHGPVLVELFTSQGCSSCPPADRLLSRLKSDPRLAGEVIPLAFHVDYWDRQGWRDPFSSAEWSRRQMSYARAFRANRIYTPQAVFDGRTECVGAEEAEVMRRIRDALAAPRVAEVRLGTPAPVAASPSSPPDTAAPGVATGGSAPAPGPVTVRIKASARLLRPVAGPAPELWVALTESGLVTPVRGGENARATLHDDQVVRRLVKAATLPAAGQDASGEVELRIEPSWSRGALDLVAFLQDPRSLAVYGAATRPLAAH